MTMIDLNQLDAHPGNANRMTEATLEKLAAHVKQSGDYPPLIVRRIGDQVGDHPHRYQILDGHHRALALRRLGYQTARCEVWEVDDQRAELLLLTLNRLQGQDDPQLRGALLEKVSQSMGMEELARWVPEESERIGRLIELNRAPPPLAEPPALEHMPQAVTFFLNQAQRMRLFERLAAVCRDRSSALVQLLGLEDQRQS